MQLLHHRTNLGSRKSYRQDKSLRVSFSPLWSLINLSDLCKYGFTYAELLKCISEELESIIKCGTSWRKENVDMELLIIILKNNIILTENKTKRQLYCNKYESFSCKRANNTIVSIGRYSERIGVTYRLYWNVTLFYKKYYWKVFSFDFFWGKTSQ